MVCCAVGCGRVTVMTLEDGQNTKVPERIQKVSLDAGEVTAVYRNPHNRVQEPKNWWRWARGEEDGRRGEQPQGKSVAYKDGYNAGRTHRSLDEQGVHVRSAKSLQ